MGNREVDQPYVVSSDGYELMTRWANQNGYKSPSEKYFADYSLELKAILNELVNVPIEIIEHSFLKEGMAELVAKSEYPVVSIDRAYLDDDPNVFAHLDITRGVTPELEDHKDIRQRPNHPQLLQQMEFLRSDELAPVVLADDVIFSGGTIMRIAKDLKAHGRPVAGVIAGIRINSGTQAIEEAGIEIKSVLEYDSVCDEVCQRDFLASTPYSGRSVFDDHNHTNWSAPYFLPFGNPEKWASIPADKVLQFSSFCLSQSVELWQEVQNNSGRDVLVTEVPRSLQGMDGKVERITDFLKRIRVDDELMKVGKG